MKVDKELTVGFEVKQTEEKGDFFFFEGMASTFGNKDLVDDVVMPGAFRESLEKETPVILWQHNSDEPIGMPERIYEQTEGLFLRGRLPKSDTLVSGRVMPQIKVGSIKTMSIGFMILDDERDASEPRVRLLKKVLLKEISLITFAANPKAKITGFKSIEDVKQFKTKRDYEKALRESGFSKDAAILMAKHFPGEPESDDAVKMLQKMNLRFSEAEQIKSLFEMVKQYD